MSDPKQTPSQTEQPVLLAVDGNWYIWRAYSVLSGGSRELGHRIPQLMLSLVVNDALALKATHIAVCFDGPEIFRYDIYPGYKSSRRKNKDGSSKEESTDAATPYEHLLTTMERLTQMGIFVIQQAKFESDDLMSSFAYRFRGQCRMVYIGTHDKDLMQCVGENVFIYWPAYNMQPTQKLNAKSVVREWGLTPSQLLDYQTLMGDAGDDIPALRGMSDKKARALIQSIPSLKVYLKSAEGLPFWKAHRDELMRNRALVTMSKRALPEEIELSHLKFKNIKDDQLSSQKAWMIPKSYYQLREMVYPRTKSLFG